MKEAYTETIYFTFDGKYLITKLINDIEIDVHHTEVDFEVSKKITEGRKYLSLVIVNPDTSITRDAQKISLRKERYTQIVAQAIVIHSLAQRIIGNFMIHFIKYPSPSKLFTSKEEAIKWLDQHWEKEHQN
jgi:hypothetical protein